MTLSMSQSTTAVTTGIEAFFLATGGTAPYVYSVLSGGAGGTITSDGGLYTAPLVLDPSPNKAFDTVRVTDFLGATVSSQILVGDALQLFCDVIKTEMNIANGKLYLWDQKIMQPHDSDLYVAVSYMTGKPIGNNISYVPITGNLTSVGTVTMGATLLVDFISRSFQAVSRKEQLLMALKSDYSQRQQTANSFYIATMPNGGTFTNLSHMDGAAIPYRFQIPINIMYGLTQVKNTEYFDSNFHTVVVTDTQGDVNDLDTEQEISLITQDQVDIDAY